MVDRAGNIYAGGDFQGTADFDPGPGTFSLSSAGDYDAFLAKTDAGGAQALLPALEWTAAHALPSGVLAEQIHPVTGEPLSVAPLTWSHATVIGAVMRCLGGK